MNWKKALGTLGIGIAIGYLIKSKVSDMPIQAERALKIAREKFKEGRTKGTIYKNRRSGG